MKRGPKTGKAAQPRRHVAEDMGEPPADLEGAGRELWLDSVAYLTAQGRARRVFRHPLALACRLYASCGTDPAITRSDAVRRLLHELGLTPASASGATEGQQHGEAAAETGKAKLFRLIGGKPAS